MTDLIDKLKALDEACPENAPHGIMFFGNSSGWIDVFDKDAIFFTHINQDCREKMYKLLQEYKK